MIEILGLAFALALTVAAMYAVTVAYESARAARQQARVRSWRRSELSRIRTAERREQYRLDSQALELRRQLGDLARRNTSRQQ